jgi:hypothetical protein
MFFDFFHDFFIFFKFHKKLDIYTKTIIMKKIKLFEQFSVEEFEINKMYESWISENGNDIRMIIEQLENDDAEEEKEKSEDDEAYDWLTDDTISAGEERALKRDLQLLSKSQMAALYLKAKGKYDSEGAGDEATREDRDIYVVGIPGILDFCRENWRTGGLYITIPGLADAMGLTSITTVTRTAKKFYQMIAGIGGTESEIIYDKLVKAYNFFRTQPIDVIQGIAGEEIQNPETANVHRATERPRQGMTREQRLAIGKRVYSWLQTLKSNPIFKETAKAQRNAIAKMNKETGISETTLKQIYKEYLIKNKLLNKFNWEL